ncbi:MAG TPA: putative 2-dehydropantoate 2-reductase [Fibrobacteria bacterium]|nr:putative 2-dehydropantoate 2-reductase [Fibrobacteria bacterium]
MASYAIIGTGAVGGYYGGLLQKAGKDVHFLARSDHAHIKSQGLRVDSPKGNFRLENVRVYDRADAMPPCDVAVIAWKSTENGRLPEVLPRVLKPGGVALVLQNGLDPEREAARAAPEAKVLGGLCFLCSQKAGPGWIRHLDYGAVTLAAYPGSAAEAQGASPAQGVTEEMRRVGEDFRAAGVEIRLHEDWRAARWRKLAWNIPFNGLCALLGTDTARLLRHPPMRAQVGALIGEVIEGAKACGCPLPADFGDRMLKDTDAMAPYEPSMKLDRDAGRPMELAAIYGRPLEEIAKAGGAAPRIRDLHAQLSFLDGRA